MLKAGRKRLGQRLRKVFIMPAADKPKYYVQVGAFAVKSLAEKYLADVKKDYPDSFIRYVKAAGLYYVQVGAFSSKENAEKYLEKVRKDYPHAFIKIE